MNLFEFMDRHPVLSFGLAVLICFTIVDVVYVIKRKS